MRRHIAPLAVLVLAATQTAVSAQTMTVQSLMDKGYTVAGITTSPTGGASIFLQKGSALVYCFAAETPTSPTVATKYCKPVK
jgi:maltoporin